MLSNKHLYAELEEAEALLKKDDISEIEYKKINIKLSTLNLKLLHNIRANSVTLMKHQGIDLLKSNPVKKDGE